MAIGKLMITRVRDIICGATARHGKIMGSMLGRDTMFTVHDARL